MFRPSQSIKVFPAFFALFFLGLAPSDNPKLPVERKLTVGKDATEARMSFKFKAQFSSSREPSTKLAKEKIEKQMVHLFGPMGEAEFKGVPKGDHKIKVLKIEHLRKSLYSASYSYIGTIVLHQDAPKEYTVTLPINPDEVYSAGMVGDHNPCTDEHYQSEGDFWYFWNPAKVGCPLKKRDEKNPKDEDDYALVPVKIKRISNSVLTYPEYSKLPDKNGVISISLLMGMDNPEKGSQPMSSSDINADNYRQLRKTFLKMGFKSRLWSEKEVYLICPGCEGKLPYVEELTKKNKKATLVIRSFFAPSGINEESKAFHYFMKDAMENASVMIYDGHSGLGGHLDLPSIESMEGFEFQPNKNRYQIYFFNSCSSYTYYNTMFFDRKATEKDPKGSKSLDILTNGLATYFYVMHDTNLALIEAIDAWADGKGTISYQKLADKIDSGNLFTIVGDEGQTEPL